MTKLSDYSQFSDGPLELPINGKTYIVPELSIPAGIALAGIFDETNKKAQKLKGVDLWKLLLGDVWDEMVADGVPLNAATRAGLTALADRQYGREFANATWETGADPKALEPYLTERAAQTGNRASRRSNSTVGAKKTPPRASTRATTSRSN